MAAPNPISQDDTFFVGMWSREVERVVLSKLDFEQWNNNWIVGDIENNKQVLRLVRDELISRPDVFYCPYENTVEASVDVWTIRPNLLVYRPKGEPCWEQMRVLFRETIAISDTHSGDNYRSGEPSHNECVSEVVNQPSALNRTYKSNETPSRTKSLSERGQLPLRLHAAAYNSTEMGDFATFYDSIWTRELEDRFLEEALAAKKNGTWQVSPDWRNSAFVERIAPLLNEKIGIKLPIAFYGEKVVRLFERQNIFQFIIGHTHVYWHKRSNEMTYMSNETFSELATLMPLAHAYKEKGEPQYLKLCALFVVE
ncbi:hypothetical protein C2S51_006698 [Perilla frutescens var. frutescens]|nr:hypothetical protein C2S51_006698 [Perilla frutescens var. frutescens]